MPPRQTSSSEVTGQLSHFIIVFSTNMRTLFTMLIIVSAYGSCEQCDEEWAYVARVHSCYLVPHHPLTWEQAEEYCQEYDAHLVSVGNSIESHFVRLMADQHNPLFLTWIGLSRETNTSDALFSWSDGSDVNYTSFRSGEPADWGNCVALSSSMETNGWMTIDCNYSQFFLCEKQANGLLPTIFTASQGSFHSPGYPDTYSDNINVNFFIELPSDHKVAITVVDIDTEDSKDFLQIFDGNEGLRAIAKISGQHRNMSFLTQSNRAMVTFSSDESDGGAGFRAVYSAWTEKPVEILRDRSGTIASEGFPDFAPPFTLQRFVIQCSNGQHVHLNVTDVDCTLDDEFSFYNGPTVDQPVLIALCDADRPVDYYRSESDSVYGVFETSDTYGMSRWRTQYHCVNNDGFGDDVIIP
ncbi:hypothetical protein Q1695_002261 [Nippostrongylus brasiliensis]|nr:hypothetical protein Q1695_002261 [Nippostrongylus brasiliensis]